MRPATISTLAWGFVLIESSLADTNANPSACKLPAISDIYLSSGFGGDYDSAPSLGTMTGFMIFVDFIDRVASETTESLRDIFIPEGPDWFSTASFGKLNHQITADTSKFFRMPNDTESYGFTRGLTWEAHNRYIQDALQAYEEKCKKLKPVDILYVVATKNASAISFSPTFMGPVTTRSGVKVAKKAVTIGYDAYVKWFSKVLNHESGHAMGLADYYPFTGGETGMYVGGWSLMGYINGASPDYFAWDKWRLGWLQDEQVDCISEAGKTTHTLSPMDTPDGNSPIKTVVVKKNETSALIAEVRSSNGNNVGSCAKGVLLYTVATHVATGTGPVVVLDSNPDSIGCDGTAFGNAPLALDGSGASSYTSPEFGVTIEVVKQQGEEYVIEVEIL
ncbi:hypothetical protein V2G26_021266 [Clonostachys chloroleuca]